MYIYYYVISLGTTSFIGQTGHGDAAPESQVLSPYSIVTECKSAVGENQQSLKVVSSQDFPETTFITCSTYRSKEVKLCVMVSFRSSYSYTHLFCTGD